MFGSELIVKLLESSDVKYVFGIPGGHLLKFYNSLYDSEKITSILTKHESGASFMATGYAQVSNGIGVCTGTVGPGATNLTTGVASAYMDSIPVLVITAQVGSSTVGKGGLQEATGEGRTIDHVELYDGITKYSTRVFDAARLPETVKNALRTAINGRPGPVHLDIMAQIFAADVNVSPGDLGYKAERYPATGTQADLKKAAEILLSGKNAAILAGAGALGAAEEVRVLAESFGIPVATTLRAKGLLPEDHELSLGCLGIYGTNAANKYLRSGIDVLLAIGTSFSEFTSHAWDSKFQPSTALIQVDVDSWEIGKNYPVTIGIHGDVRQVLADLIPQMHSGGKKRLGSLEELKKLKEARHYFADPMMSSDATPIKPQRFMKLLRETLPPETIVFGDIGNTLPWLEGFFQVLAPGSFFICSSLASMGYGVSASIGGQLAAPGRQVVCVCGDGDFQMQGMEVVTAVNYGIPVKWFIMNNQTLAMVSNLQELLFNGRRIASDFINPDFLKLAEAMGAAGLRITKPEEVVPVTEAALKNGRPTVIDVQIDAEEFPSFDARAEAMSNAWGAKTPLYKKLKFIPELLKRL